MKYIIEKIKKYLEKLEDEIQFSEDEVDAGNIVSDIKIYIAKLEEEQASKTFLDRLKEERDDVAKKLDNLNIFLDKVFIEHTVFISETQAHYLKEQREYMQGYLSVLDARLEDFAKNERNK